jgi:hypothetical protein
MGHAFLLAGVLGLVAYAFGARSAVILARILIVGAVLAFLVLVICAINVPYER